MSGHDKAEDCLEPSDPQILLGRLAVELSGDLLALALTHRSYAYEQGGIPNNERLEFLGDSVLGQAVTVMLYETFPDLDEGELAKRRSSLVSSAALAEVAEAIGLGEFLLLGRGESLSGGRTKGSILADTVEALIGAVYLGAGPEQATELVLRLIMPLMDDADRFGIAMDPKTALQELAASRELGAPIYEVRASGPDHNREFHAEVAISGGVSARGDGSSKKQAEIAAALKAYQLLAADTKQRKHRAAKADRDGA